MSVSELQPETSSSPASDVYPSADDTAPPMENESLSLGQYQRKLQQRDISVTGTDLVINDDNTFSFRLLLENKSSSNALPVTGTFADDEYDTFVAATWGGLSVLDDDTLVVYTRGQIHFLSLSTLETKVPSPELTDYKDCWVLGVGNTGDGYIAALGGSDLSRIVYLDASGNITKTVDADNPSSFRDRDIDYFTRKDRYTAGLVFNVFPVMGTIQFDAPNREMVLLNQYAHSSWAAHEGNDAGHLDYYLLFDPATGTLIDASEEFNHVDGDKRYALLHYTSNNPDDQTGYIGMYYENDVRKAVIAFAGPPNYFTFGDEGIDWTVKGNQVQIVNSHGCQYITLDFDKMTGSAEYRFTQEDLANDVLAASPGGRYSLQAVNMSGAGDGYWGQVVLADSETGNIQYVCNMPVRYGGDAASTNFSDDSHFTTADGQTLRIYAVNTPDQYRTLELYLPWDDSNVIYCNSIYDIRNDRYLLTYLDEVGVNRGGWHDYETAVYHVAVFDNALQVVKDVIVPELEAHIPDVSVEERAYFPEPPPPTTTRRRPPRQSWEIEAVEEPKKNRVKKTKAPKEKKERAPLFGGKRKKDKSRKADAMPVEKKKGKKEKKKRSFPWKKEKQPDLSPLESGAVTVPDLLAPASADFTSRDYVVVDGVYHAYLYITGYGYTTIVGNGWLNPLIEAGEDVNINFFIRRQPKDKILSSIAKTTMINRSRMRDVGDTRQDYEELDSAINSGMYLKENINRSGEDFYYMHTLIEAVADDPDTLEQRLSATEILCTSLDLVCRRCDYRQEQAYLSSLPLLGLDPDIERKSRRNVLTTGVAAAFPFSSFEICDQNGIMLGINLHNRSVCMLDIFDATKYANANMSLLGMSGAGKTFLLQLIAMRLRQQDVQVMILAPLKGFEFRPACEAIGGKYIKISPSSDDCINIMEIRRATLDTDAELGRDRGDSLLADKIAKLHIFFALLKPNITDEERNYLDSALVDCYERFGITHNNASLYGEDGSFKPMPILKDLYEVLRESADTKSLSVVLSRFVTGSASRLGQHTNVDLDNKYIVMDISEMGKDLLPLGMFLALDYCWDKCKESRVQKKALMLDELWCLIGASSNPLAADYVLEIFKVIRGYGGSAVCATQDLSDFFALENGKYGKAIINNSRTKIVLPLEEDEAMRVKEVLGLSDEETMQIIRNKTGEGLLCAGHNRISVAFQSTKAEYAAITTRRSDLEAQLQSVKKKH